jgi:type I restriction enzyme, S subunit
MSSPALRFREFDGDWKSVRFDDELVESKLGGNYANSETPTKHPLIKMGNLGRGLMNLRKIEFIEVGETIDPKDRMKDGDLFFNTRNTLDLVGKVAIWRSELPEAYYNSNLMRITFACNHFMNYRLNSYSGVKALRRLATGTTSVAAIYTRDLLQMKIGLPALPEQRKIADFLTAVDRRIAQLCQKKALLEEYKKGVMQQLFTQALRFKDDHGNDFPEWEEKTLGAVCRILKGKGLSKADLVEDGATPCIRYGELYTTYSELIQEPKSRTNVAEKELVLSEENDVIIPASGETHIDIATASCVMSKGIALGGDLNIIRTKLNGVFLAYYLNNARKHAIARVAQGSSVIHLYPDQLKGLSLRFPSTAEQTKIANFLTALDRKIESVSSQISHTQAFKKGLLQQMFV